MGPRGPREEIADQIRATGCVVRTDPIRGGMIAVDCPNYRARCDLVDAMAWRDAMYDGSVRMLALELLADLPSHDAESIARRVHAAVCHRVRYLGEAGDQIQEPLVTWTYGLGDCDCQARLVLALCRSVGVPVSCVGWLGRDAQGEYVRHVVGAFQGPRGLRYMETTLGPHCAFGEHPLRAAERLGLMTREDLG